MALKTEGKAISDFLKYEVPEFSREALLVAASQTLTKGMVCGPGAGGRRAILGAEVNEVQTVTITGAASGGTMLLGFTKLDGSMAWTDPIAAAAATTAATIETGCDSALGAGVITVTGTGAAFTLAFVAGGYEKMAQPLIEIDISAATSAEDATVVRTTPGGHDSLNAAVNCVQTVANTGTAGNYILTFIDYTGTPRTAIIPWDAADVAAVQTLLDAMTNFAANDVVASGTVHTAMALTFSGANYAGKPQTLITQDLSGYTYTAAGVTMTTLGSFATSSFPDCVILENVTTSAGEVTTSANFLRRHAVLIQEQLDFNLGNMQDAIQELAKYDLIVRTAAGTAHV